MNTYLVPLSITAIVGAGVVTGLLFAFSNFVMRALADLPSEQGMFAMQRINERIINPVFMMFFLGTPAACVAMVFLSLGNMAAPGHPWLMAGAVCYLFGPFGITLSRNVPLNNRLAGSALADAESVWPEYRTAWQFWNHLRSYIGILSMACMALGLADLRP